MVSPRVKLVVELLELFRLPEAREGVPLEALEDFVVPEAALGIRLAVMVRVCL